MSNNKTSALKVIFWSTLIIFGTIIFSCYIPIIKDKLNSAIETGIAKYPATSIVTSTKSNVFASYEISGCNVAIDKYGEGIVFDSSNNYTVDVLKEDMGYVLTSIEPTGTPPKIYHFVGKGWYNMITYPIEQEQVVIEPSEQPLEFEEEQTIENTQ